MLWEEEEDSSSERSRVSVVEAIEGVKKRTGERKEKERNWGWLGEEDEVMGSGFPKARILPACEFHLKKKNFKNAKNLYEIYIHFNFTKIK